MKWQRLILANAFLFSSICASCKHAPDSQTKDVKEGSADGIRTLYVDFVESELKTPVQMEVTLNVHEAMIRMKDFVPTSKTEGYKAKTDKMATEVSYTLWAVGLGQMEGIGSQRIEDSKKRAEVDKFYRPYFDQLYAMLCDLTANSGYPKNKDTKGQNILFYDCGIYKNLVRVNFSEIKDAKDQRIYTFLILESLNIASQSHAADIDTSAYYLMPEVGRFNNLLQRHANGISIRANLREMRYQ